MSLKGLDNIQETVMAVSAVSAKLADEGIKVWRSADVDEDVFVEKPSLDAFERLCVLYDRLCTQRGLSRGVEWWYTCPKCGQLVHEGESCDCWKAQFAQTPAPAAPPAPPEKRAAKRKISARTVMVLLSVVVAAVVVGFSIGALGGQALAGVGIAVLICAPPLFHKFVIPEKMQVRHYFQVVGHYMLFWGVFPALFLSETGRMPGAVFTAIGITAVACYAIGALLPRKRQ